MGGRYFACNGAAITTIAIGTGPFIQRAVELNSRPMPNSNLIAKTTMAHTYDGNLGMSAGAEFSTMSK